MRQAEGAGENAGSEHTGPAQSLIDHASPGSATEDGEVNEQDDVASGEQAAELSGENLPVCSKRKLSRTLQSFE